MEDFSFDPRSWARKQADGPRKGQLPDAWDKVATDFRPGAQGPAPQTCPEPASGRMAPALPWLASLLLLASGATWAWSTRSAPGAAPPAAGATAPPTKATGIASLPEGSVERALNLGSPGELEGALASLGVPPAEAGAAWRAARGALARSGMVRARIVLQPRNGGFALQELHASYEDGSGALVSRDAAGRFAAVRLGVDLKRVIRVTRGEIDSESFYGSAVAAGVTDTLVPEFINAFAYDFNLAAEIVPGDTFEVAFEQTVNAQGEEVGLPKLLFASLTNRSKSLALYRFVGPGGEVGWYDGNGASTRRGLMRTPVDGARISSKFGMRFHPVLHYNRLHGGTDFAAPIGTPIYAAADGVVEFAAYKGANGNLTVVRHDNGWRTLYLHQNRFMPGIAPGARVMQGQHIGDIGTTGRSTGPHLHYEVHIDGQRVDPLSIRTDDARRKRMDGTLLAAFRTERDRVDGARAQQN